MRRDCGESAGEKSQAEADGPGRGRARDGRLAELSVDPVHGWSGGAVGPAQQKGFRCKLRRTWKGKKGIRIEETESSDGRRQPGSERLSREGRCQEKGLFEMPWGRAQVTLSKVATGVMAKAKFLPEVQKVGTRLEPSWEKTLLLKGPRRLREDAGLDGRRGKGRRTQGKGERRTSEE